jgi:hypothetical protein
MRKAHVEGFIELANHRLGRYAVRTDAGDYTLFETVGRVPLEVDELVWGDFCSVPGETYRTERHGAVAVVALRCHCARRDAAHWVHERQPSAEAQARADATG